MRQMVAPTTLLALSLLVAGTASCGRPCRTVEVASLSFACASSATFRGERHFDDAATFESFLEIECIPDASSDEVAGILGQVDFSRDAAFVASNERNQGTRCLEQRRLDEVEVCDDGMHVTFADQIAEESAEESACGGTWTVAFAIPRDELRAAIGAAEAGAPQ